MKDSNYTDIICKGFCRYYKEGREDLLCGTYKFLRNNTTPNELQAFLKLSKAAGQNSMPTFSMDDEIKDLVCKKCDFLVDGCDFREDASHPPCGGYTILEWLLKYRAL